MSCGIKVALQSYSESSGMWVDSEYHYFSSKTDTEPLLWNMSYDTLYRIRISPENIGASDGSGSDTFNFSFSK